MANPFADAWNTAVREVLRAVDRGEASAEQALSGAAKVISDAAAQGQIVLTEVQHRVLDLLKNPIAPQAASPVLHDVFTSQFQNLRGYLTYFGRVVPAVNHNGHTYLWSEARKTPEGMAWFLMAACIADYRRFSRALGRDAMALDVVYGADDGGETPEFDSAGNPVESTSSGESYGDPGAGSGYSIPDAPAGDTPAGQGHAPPAQSPDVAATVSAVIAVVMKIGKDVIGFFHPPDPAPTYTPAKDKKEEEKKKKEEDDGSGFMVLLVIAVVFYFATRKDGQA